MKMYWERNAPDFCTGFDDDTDRELGYFHLEEGVWRFIPSGEGIAPLLLLEIARKGYELMGWECPV